MELIPGFIILALILFGTPWARAKEKELWNEGVCEETGEYWIRFDMDSQGGRGYASGEYTIWISYSVDKNYNHFERAILNDRHTKGINCR